MILTNSINVLESFAAELLAYLARPSRQIHDVHSSPGLQIREVLTHDLTSVVVDDRVQVLEVGVVLRVNKWFLNMCIDKFLFVYNLRYLSSNISIDCIDCSKY